MSQTNRRVGNLLLQPLVQMRIGLANVVASLLFVVLLGLYAYRKLVAFGDVVATLTQADAAVKGLMTNYLASIGMTALIASVGFVLVNLILSVYLTHKLVGPTIAFRRHIRALNSGNFQARTVLRTGDAFGEVADELNQLSATLAGLKIPGSRS